MYQFKSQSLTQQIQFQQQLQQPGQPIGSMTPEASPSRAAMVGMNPLMIRNPYQSPGK